MTMTMTPETEAKLRRVMARGQKLADFSAVQVAVAAAVPDMAGKRKTKQALALVEGIGIATWRATKIPGGIGPVKRGPIDWQDRMARFAVDCAWPRNTKGCPKCGGTGFISSWGHVEGGRCFKCN